MILKFYISFFFFYFERGSCVFILLSLFLLVGGQVARDDLSPLNVAGCFYVRDRLLLKFRIYSLYFSLTQSFCIKYTHSLALFLSLLIITLTSEDILNWSKHIPFLVFFQMLTCCDITNMFCNCYSSVYKCIYVYTCAIHAI